jgi:hypothetical protein
LLLAGLALFSASISATRLLFRSASAKSLRPIGCVDDACLVGTVLHLASLGVLDSRCHVRGHGADFRVRHQAARSENLAQRADDTHGVRRSDHDVERHVAGLDAFSQVFHANDIGAGSTGCLGLVAGGEHGNANALAGAGWQHDGAADDLVRLLGIHAQLNRHVDRFIELGGSAFLDQRDCVVERIQLGAIDFGP